MYHHSGTAYEFALVGGRATGCGQERRTGTVARHEPCMDVRLLVQRAARLHPNLLAEIQQRVHKRRRDARKAQTVRHSKRRPACRITIPISRILRRGWWFREGTYERKSGLYAL